MGRPKISLGTSANRLSDGGSAGVGGTWKRASGAAGVASCWHDGNGLRGWWREDRGEPVEEGVGHLLGGGVDQPRAELGDLAADLRFHVVGQQRVGPVIGQRNLGAALGEAGDAALALARDGVAVRRVDVGQLDTAGEARGDRPDLHRGGRLHLVVRGLLQAVAAGNAGLQHLPGRSARPIPCRAAPGCAARRSYPFRCISPLRGAEVTCRVKPMQTQRRSRRPPGGAAGDGDAALPRASLLAALLLPTAPCLAAAAGPVPGLQWDIPFAGLLLSIAVLPIVAPHFWHKRMRLVALGWCCRLAGAGGDRLRARTCGAQRVARHPGRIPAIRDAAAGAVHRRRRHPAARRARRNAAWQYRDPGAWAR